MAKSGGGSDCDYIFKIILIGDMNVGKTNLILRFTRDEFRAGTKATIGVEFAFREIIIDGKKIKAQIWDTAGSELFKAVVPQLYRGADGFFVVFDLTRIESFNNITYWTQEVQKHVSLDLPIILIGNKSDLDTKRRVSREHAKALAQRFQIPYIETSALNASNIEEALKTLVTTIYNRKKYTYNPPVEDPPIPLSDDPKPQKTCKCS